jgi:hypothetical protein
MPSAARMGGTPAAMNSRPKAIAERGDRGGHVLRAPRARPRSRQAPGGVTGLAVH